MNTRTLLVRLVAVATFAVGGAQLCAQPAIINDSPNDIAAGISTGSGTLDILAMEVTDTVDDVIFTLTVNGNISSTDWGNFMIGIATLKSPGTTTGNGWARPINLNAGEIDGVAYGMTHWIGSWVNSGGGAQLWDYSGASWGQTSSVKTFTLNPGTTSTIVYTVTKASLGVATGDQIFFDAYSSGGGGGDTSVDALSNPNIAVTAWNQTYTSSAATGISSYTLTDSALNVTTDVTFSVDMKAQIAIGTFDPAAGDIVSAYWGTDRANYVDLADPEADGIYTGTASISAPDGTPVSYYYEILPFDLALPLIPESVSRSFIMQDSPLLLGTVFFNNAPDYRNVTFTVDMSVQESVGTFDPATQTVELRGSFNDWAGTPMTALGGGLYTTTVLIGGANGASVEYKYYAAGPSASGYEGIAGNRTVLLEINDGGNPSPAQELAPVFFSNQTAARNVMFSVDMSVQVALGLFNPDETDPAVGGIVQVRGIAGNYDSGPQLTREASTLVYSGTFPVVGDEGSTLGYKFWSPGLNFYNVAGNTGFEQIILGDPFSNRTATLEADGVAMNLASVYFSNQLFYVTGTPFTSFSTTAGTASAAQNVTVDGQGLTANIAVTTPVGFEVSTDGINYSATADIPQTSDSVAGATLSVRVAASAPSGSLGGNVTLTSTGSQPVDIAVSASVTAEGETFANWSGGQVLTPALEIKYAIGGASAPGAGDGVPSVTSLTTDTLSITAVVRTNDPTLTVAGQSVADLVIGGWSDADVTVTPQPLEPAPAGCEVQTFSTPRGIDGKKFLRLQTTLPATP